MNGLFFFDLETTGADTNKDRIVQISILYGPNVDSLKSLEYLVNPGINISKEAEEVHGISNEMVKGCPDFFTIAKDIFSILSNSKYLGGYNIRRFDVPILLNEFLRSGINWDWTRHKILDVMGLYSVYRPRTLTAAYMDLVNPLGFDDSHDTGADTKATLEVFKKLSEIGFPDSEGEQKNDLDFLASVSNYGKEIVDLDGKFGIDSEGDIIFKFGKHINKKAKGHMGFLKWMLDKDFSFDTLRVAKSFFTK